MKDKGKSLFILVALIGAIIVGCSYYFVTKPNKEKAATIQAENDVLQARVDTLEIYKKNEPEYKAQISKNLDDVAAVLEKYPADTRYEDAIMQAVSLQLGSSINFTGIIMGDKEDVLEISDETVKNMNREEYISGMAYEVRECTYSNELTYPALKIALAEILKNDNRVGIKNITYSKNVVEDEILLGGVFVLDFYCVRGTNKEYVAPVIPEYENGTENIFGKLETEEEEGQQKESID